MPVDAAEHADGAATVRHGLGSEEVSVWVQRADGTRIAPFFAQVLDADRVEVVAPPIADAVAFVVQAAPYLEPRH